MKNTEKKNKLPVLYIALCCCVLVIGITGYVIEQKIISPNNSTSNTAAITQTEIPTKMDKASSVETDTNVNEDNTKSVSNQMEYEETATPIPTASLNPTQKPTQKTIDSSNQLKDMDKSNTEETSIDYTLDNPDTNPVSVNVTPPTFSLPVQGEILSPFSTELTYNDISGDWRCHNGIDIEAPKGTPVKAAANGIVEEVSNDIYGAFVIISHSGDYQTKYFCLEQSENLKKGSEIKQGDVIGTVGIGTPENITEPHLHFEIYQNNTPINPEEMIHS